MISEGFSKKEIAEKLDVQYNPDMGSLIDKLIMQTMGKSYTEANLELISKRMEKLMDEGYQSLLEFESMFKGMDSVRVFRFLSNRRNNIGNEYLKGIVSSAILKLQKDGRRIGDTSGWGIYYRTISIELGNVNIKHSLEGFIKREMNKISDLTQEDLVNGLKYYASKLIMKSENAYDLLRMLNYDEGIEIHQYEIINQRIENLFEMSYEDAFRFYSSKILNV